MEILKFYSTSCTPCNALELFLKEKEYNTININVDEDPDMAIKYRVRGVPTLIKIENDVEVDRLIGFNANTKNKVEAMYA